MGFRTLDSLIIHNLPSLYHSSFQSTCSTSFDMGQKVMLDRDWPEKAAVVRSREVAAKQGFLMYYTKGVAIGTEVSVRYKESGRFSGVVVKRGSTVNT